MIAADIMRKEVVTVRDTATVKELAQLLLERRISGAPVVDASGKLVGVVSQTDLVRGVREDPQPHEVPAYHADLDRWLGRRGFQVETPDFKLVREVMTPGVIAADAKTPVIELARTMSRKRIHRLIITDKKKIAGIVTSMDILQAFVRLHGELVEAP
jgi:CBS domain-containing protein